MSPGKSPSEGRRKRTFDRLNYRAERADKVVLVNNGILSPEGIQVLSLTLGKILRNGQ